jgi:hypothetical protein
VITPFEITWIAELGRDPPPGSVPRASSALIAYAARDPAAAASTTAALPTVASPAAKTPGTLVRPSSSMTIMPSSSRSQPSWAGSGLGVNLGA